MADDVPRNRSRETLLAVMLTLMALGGFAFFLTMISGGWFIYLVLLLMAMVAFGGLHYLMWGRLMVQETAGEREEAALQDQSELREWDLPETDSHRRA